MTIVPRSTVLISGVLYGPYNTHNPLSAFLSALIENPELAMENGTISFFDENGTIRHYEVERTSATATDAAGVNPVLGTLTRQYEYTLTGSEEE